MKVYRPTLTAAKAHDMEVEQAADNIHNFARELKSSGKIDEA
jgi:hypothetical protein